VSSPFLTIAKRFCVGFALSLSLAVPSVFAEEGPPSSSPRNNISEGFVALYNLDYVTARRNFQVLVDSPSTELLGYTGLVVTSWWELTNEYDENDPAAEKEFLKLVERSVVLCKKRMAEDDPHGLTHLCYGALLGIKSRWEIVQGQWLKAYLDGKQAYKLQYKAVQINPQLYDAYLGVGIFHYYTDTLPKLLKILTWLVIRGDRELGIQEIKSAMTQGQFSSQAAKCFLIDIYSNIEKNYPEADRVCVDLRVELPESSFAHLVHLMAIQNLKDWPRLEKESNEYLARIERGLPSYRPAYKNRGLFALANSYMGMKRYDDAIALYSKIINELDNGDRWVTWTILQRGKCHDLKGDRAAARADYQRVLKRRNVWLFHDHAKKVLKNPFVSTPDQPI